jgi:hypothetical protein
MVEGRARNLKRKAGAGYAENRRDGPRSTGLDADVRWRRATVVRDLLMGQFGIDGGRLSTAVGAH